MPSAAFPNRAASVTSADSQCVMATMGADAFSSAAWRTSSAAPLVWPDTSSRSGRNALTLSSVVVMSLRSRGSLSSITTCMPWRAASSITPARMSCENGSFSVATAMVSDAGSRPSACACSAARLIASCRYCSEVDSTANR